MMDTEALIAAVQKHPILWDTTVYKNKQKKSDSWLKVVNDLYEDCNEQSKEQQKLALQDVMVKWRTVRDNYIRNQKKQAECIKAGLKKVKPYIYSDKLSFLSRNMDQKVREEPETELVKLENDPIEIIESIKTDSDADSSQESTSVSKVKVPFASEKRKLDEMHDALANAMQVSKTTRKTAEYDEDVAFFYSLLPAVRRLTPDKKFAFRIQMMQILLKINQMQKYDC